MTNYIARLVVSTGLAIQNKIRDGVAWEISDFEELIVECEKERLDRRCTRSLVLKILEIIPRMDKDARANAWKEISGQFLPAKEYTVTKINMETATEAEVAEHLSKVFAAKVAKMAKATA